MKIGMKILVVLLSAHILYSGPAAAGSDELMKYWNNYKENYIKEGRVVELDENGITTSEGQSYAMLRAVWCNDRKTFDEVWRWTKKNLQMKDRHLFSWLWKGAVLDLNSATDADQDIALALILASRKYHDVSYRNEALQIIRDIWTYEIAEVEGKPIVSAGNWAPWETYITVHPAYFAPYAYEVFAEIDHAHPWKEVITSSYEILHWIYFEKTALLPPEKIYVEKSTGRYRLTTPSAPAADRFSYDLVPLFWRIALDFHLNGREERPLRKAMLKFFEQREDSGLLGDVCTIHGQQMSTAPFYPIYPTVHSLAMIENSTLAPKMKTLIIDEIWRANMNSTNLDKARYYINNWMWFSRAFELNRIKFYDNIWDKILSLVEMRKIEDRFPLVFICLVFALFTILNILARMKKSTTTLYTVLKMVFLLSCFYLCTRYLWWRIFSTLNVHNPVGVLFSLMLLFGEIYCVCSLFFKFCQLGFAESARSSATPEMHREFSVDIFITVYTEPLSVLERTVRAAKAVDYRNKTIHILDDGHRSDVVELTQTFGVNYIRGPRKGGKAGNINNALGKTHGELVAIFDIDHLPLRPFLRKTVPYFEEEKVGLVQVPHFFYNEDIFQKTFKIGFAICNEQDMFHHRMQKAMGGWGSCIFTGTCAVIRRAALAEIGGILTMSVTEDIHTGMHLNARGWKSIFVDRILSAGLSPENIQAHIIQRTRWMHGCLQVLFKDNPLFLRGLSLRQRFSYLGSLSYFLFPLFKLVIWVSPLSFLLVHIFPIAGDHSYFLAYLLPYLIVLPLVNSVTLAFWPRSFWGELYEYAVCFPLFFKMFELLMPGSISFKVTPKGVTQQGKFYGRLFLLTFIPALLTIAAILKGTIEMQRSDWPFGYAITIVWAIYTVVFLIPSLLLYYEQRSLRNEPRFPLAVPVEISGEGHPKIRKMTKDISSKGLCVITPIQYPLEGKVVISIFSQDPILARARCVDVKKLSRGYCYGFELMIDQETQNVILSRLLTEHGFQLREKIHQTQSSFRLLFIAIFGIGNYLTEFGEGVVSRCLKISGDQVSDQ